MNDVQTTEFDVASGINPLVWAADGVLAMIPGVRRLRRVDDASALWNTLVEKIRIFKERAEAAGVSREDVIGARYCLCTALDEAIADTPWGTQGMWPQQSLLALFHNEIDGGEKYYRLLARLVQNPAKHRNLIELIYYCNALGFEGSFKNTDDGQSRLEVLRQRLADILSQRQGARAQRLSPHWAGTKVPRPPAWRLVSPWVVAGICALIAGVCYLGFMFSLDERSNVPFARMTAMDIWPEQPKAPGAQAAGSAEKRIPKAEGAQ